VDFMRNEEKYGIIETDSEEDRRKLVEIGDFFAQDLSKI